SSSASTRAAASPASRSVISCIERASSARRRRGRRRRLDAVAPAQALTKPSQRHQILGEVALVAFREPETEMAVVMLDDVLQRLEPAVVIEAALRVRP